MKNIFPSVLAIIILCGCLPPGNPPPGNITGNEITLPKNRDEIREKVIAELTAAILSHAPGMNICLDYDKYSASDMLFVWQECAKFTGSKLSDESDLMIISRNNNGHWLIKMVLGKKVICNIRYSMSGSILTVK